MPAGTEAEKIILFAHRFKGSFFSVVLFWLLSSSLLRRSLDERNKNQDWDLYSIEQAKYSR